MKQLQIILLGLLFSISSMAQPPKPPSVEERLQRLQTELAKEMVLSAGKKKVISEAFKTFFAAMDNLQKDKQPPAPPKKETVDQLAKSRDAKIEKVLSKAEYEKYLKVEERLRPRPNHHQPPPQH